MKTTISVCAGQVQVVDICTFSDFNESGRVDVLDLTQIVNQLNQRPYLFTYHLNVKKSLPPFKEMINTIDLNAATTCWGFRQALPGGGQLHDIDVQVGGTGYQVVAELSGNVASLESIIVLPSQSPLTFSAQPYDLLLTGHTKIISHDSSATDNNGRYVSNAFREIGNRYRNLVQQHYPLLTFNSQQTLDLVNLQPLQPGEPFRAGIAVQVVFADFTTAILRKKFDYAHITDIALHRALTAALQLPDGAPLPGSLVRSVTSLDLSDAQISDLTGIEAFENLETLRLDNNALRSLPDLSQMTALRELSLAGNQLFRLPSLPSSLRELDLGANNLWDLGDLSRFSNLQVLKVNDNKLTSLSAHLPNLVELNCSGNDLLALPNMPKSLQVLYADHNMLMRLPSFAANSLRILHASHNAINTIENLANNLHSGLEEVVIDHNMLDMRSCAVLSHLREIMKKNAGLLVENDQAYSLAVCSLSAVNL